MNKYGVNSGIHSLYANRSLFRLLFIRDIETWYSGMLFGFLWAMVYPLIMLAVYSFVFGGMLYARWLEVET